MYKPQVEVGLHVRTFVELTNGEEWAMASMQHYFHCLVQMENRCFLLNCKLTNIIFHSFNLLNILQCFYATILLFDNFKF